MPNRRPVPARLSPRAFRVAWRSRRGSPVLFAGGRCKAHVKYRVYISADIIPRPTSAHDMQRETRDVRIQSGKIKLSAVRNGSARLFSPYLSRSLSLSLSLSPFV